MAKVKRSGEDFLIKASPSESALLEGAKDREFEVFRPKKGIFLLMEKSAVVEAEEKRRLVSGQVLELLARLPLEELVEGAFEKHLGKEQLGALAELVKSGMVRKFRLSPKYKKAVYRIAETQGVEIHVQGQRIVPHEHSASQEQGQKQALDPVGLFNSRGFIIIRSESIAQMLSNKFREEIRHNEIRGTKNFENEFCIIDSGLYERLRPQLLGFLKQKKQAYLSEVYQGLGVSRELAKIACEIAKEDGEIFEKKKEFYCNVE